MSEYAEYAQLAEKNGINRNTFWQRVNRLNWDLKKAATKPVETDYAVYKGDELKIIGTLEECAEYMELSEHTIRCIASPKRRQHAIRVGGTYAIRLEDDDE